MRYIIGFLTGVLGMLAGWFGLAMLVIALAGPDRDGGIAMGAFFQIGPLGGIVGFALGVLAFVKFGQTRRAVAPADIVQPGTAPAPHDAPPVRRRVSPVFAVTILLITVGLAYWGWYELIRSPYLTHGYMDLALQFKLPPGMDLPANSDDVHISVDEGGEHDDVLLGAAWHGTDTGQHVILATVMLDRKTSNRVVTFEMSGVALQSWVLDLPYDPDSMPGFTDWQLASGKPAPAIEMNYQLMAEH